MDNDLQDIETILQRISNTTVTAEHLIQHIQGFNPSDKQTLPSEHIKMSTWLENIIYVVFFCKFA